jgi:hypothetical protein
MNPFDYVNSISSNKKNMMRGTDNDELGEKSYQPYMVNKALSYYADTLLYANEMNRYSQLDNKMQYEYLLDSIRPGKRFSKWSKKTEDKAVQAVSRYFSVSMKRAEEYVKVLKSEDIHKIIREIQEL